VGTTEYEYVEAMGEKFVLRINQEFMKAGMRGISLLFASGDRASQPYKGKYWVCKYVYVYVYVCIYLCACVRVYVTVCVHTHKHARVHTHTHTHTHTFR
jgi:hypothetical protein